MSDDDLASPDHSGPDPEQSSVLSATSALRLLLTLLALWTLISGLALTFFQDASGATIGGRLSGGESNAAQRLLGVHMLVLAPLYGLLAWEPKRYRLLLWVPYATLGGTLAVTLFDIVTGDRDFQDGVLPFVVNLTFFALLVYVWRASRPEQVAISLPESAAPAIEAPAPVQGPEEQQV